MHAKVSVLDLMALKILLLPEDMLVETLNQQSEIAAFVNTLHKFPEAIRGANMLSKMYADEVVSGSLKSTATSSSSKSQQQQEINVNTRPVVVDNSILDRTIEMISKGGLSVQNEDKPIDLTLNMNPNFSVWQSTTRIDRIDFLIMLYVISIE